MELVITPQDLEPLPKRNNDLVTQPLGILNSNYQQVVKENLNQPKYSSIFGIKQRVKNRQFLTSCTIGTTLKVSLFLLCLIIAIN